MAQGVSWVSPTQSYNFALYSRFAGQVTLLLYKSEDLIHAVVSYRFHPLRNKTGRVWHARIPESQTGDAKYYAYSVEGSIGVSGPYSSGIPSTRTRSFWTPTPKRFSSHHRSIGVSSGRPAATPVVLPLACSARTKATDFDWGSDPRLRHDSDLIVYQMHVRGFTVRPKATTTSTS